MSKVKLREIERDDLPKIHTWRNDKSIVNHLGNNFIYIAEAIDEKWYDNYIANRDKAVRLAIITLKEDQFIGFVNLTDIHPINKTAEYSICIGEKDYWSKGVGTEATRQILEHGFENLNLHRIYLTVLEINTRAIKMYERFGFQREGSMREAVYKNGEFLDMATMAILKKEYDASR